MEVVVALVVLEIGMLGVMGTVLLASRTMIAAEVRERAVLEAQRVADSLGTHGTGGPGHAPCPGATSRGSIPDEAGSARWLPWTPWGIPW